MIKAETKQNNVMKGKFTSLLKQKLSRAFLELKPCSLIVVHVLRKIYIYITPIVNNNYLPIEVEIVAKRGYQKLLQRSRTFLKLKTFSLF